MTPNQELKGLAELVVRLTRPDGSSVDLTDASVVLLRVRNDGRRDIEADEFVQRVKFRFPGRTVIGVQIKDADDSLLDTLLGPKTVGRGTSRRVPPHDKEVLTFPIGGDYVELPSMRIGKGKSFRMLVLLRGQAKGVTAQGELRNGNLVADKARLGSPSRTTAAALLSGTGAALVALVVAIWLANHSAAASGGGQCVPGALAVSGSTAFAPTSSDLATRYHQSCPAADVSVNASGHPTSSFGGVLDLATSGHTDQSVRDSRLANSDGLATGFPELRSQPVAVVIFSVVVNTADGVYSLTRDELAAIYSGRITNWSALHGPDLPIRIVSRGFDSGTRSTFDTKILNQQAEPDANSRNCVDRDETLPAAPVVRCEMQSTEAVLRQVNAIPGAIGYAEMAATSSNQPAAYPQLRQIQLGGYDASSASVKNGGYPFWTVEYFYTYGTPDQSSPAAAFLLFLTSDTAKSTMQQDGHIPCSDPEAEKRGLCRAPS
ncbi:MAG TPA: substrate-binding domain-containing protein [Pseudonocardia sp.]|nr:substrate-binding domain-containing protein [Pseudonocardia sp.]